MCVFKIQASLLIFIVIMEHDSTSAVVRKHRNGMVSKGYFEYKMKSDRFPLNYSDDHSPQSDPANLKPHVEPSTGDKLSLIHI